MHLILHYDIACQNTRSICCIIHYIGCRTCREMDGRFSITKAQTPTGTTFQFINMYQFTAANPQGQTEMWTATENWINKQKDNRIILQGDLNSAHPGGRWDYAQPLNKEIGTADKKLDTSSNLRTETSIHNRNILRKERNAERH